MKSIPATAIVLATLALLTGAASATVMKSLTLEDIEGYAREVFVGTVLSTECIEDDGPRKLIYTEVTFQVGRSLKGTFRNATVMYRFAGGTVGKRTLRVIGMPKFEPGQRCLLFMNPDVDGLCPAIGWWQGRYLYRKDAEKTDRLHDSDGRPVYGFANGRPILDPPTTKDSKGDARPMVASAFEEHLGHVIARGEERRKREAEEAEKKPEAEAPGKHPEVTK